MTKSFTGNILAEFADRLLTNAGDNSHIVIGPVVWEPAPGGRRWYFVTGSSGQDGSFGTNQIAAADRPLAEEARRALCMALIQRRPVVIHDMDDELAMAKWCAAIWPGPRTAAVVDAIRRERAADDIRK